MPIVTSTRVRFEVIRQALAKIMHYFRLYGRTGSKTKKKFSHPWTCGEYFENIMVDTSIMYFYSSKIRSHSPRSM